MDITWYGHSCFRITERGRVTAVTDPFGADIGLPVPQRLKGDIVTVSHDAVGHNHIDIVRGRQYVLSGPGEYEIGGIFVTGIAMHNITEDGAYPNVAYLFDYTPLTVLHLGDLAHVPGQSTIEALGEVNVVLVPVGGGRGLRASQAAEVISLIEPNYIIPMHYQLPGLAIELEPVEKFLKAMGVSKVQEAETLRVTASSLPEQPQVILLTPQE